MKTIKVLLFSFFISIFGCIRKECTEVDKNFRPHKVRHCNKSKVYWYYHNTPCDCRGLSIDLCTDCNYQKTYKNYVEYYDNGEIIYGR